jgi:hypothetical protein
MRRLEDDDLWQADSQGRPQRARPPRKEKRSRLVAVAVLVAVALVILIFGLTAGSDGSGFSGGQTSPFSLLPITNDVVTSTVP